MPRACATGEPALRRLDDGSMRVLLIGGGGREHALALALVRSRSLIRLWTAPGNAGTAALGKNIQLDSHAETVAFARANAVDLVVIGPEAPLATGLADALRTAGVRTFGPGGAAAQLEASKAFTKTLCDEAGIPTAAYARFDAPGPALEWLETRPMPIVVKADGLMAGKGVVVAEGRLDARDAIAELGARGPIVLEEKLIGEEASLFALVTGSHAVPFGTARDYKRVGDGDTGPNTGGMGSISPSPALTPERITYAMDRIVRPAARAMEARGTPFTGFLYAGLMLTADGPKLIEFNVRLGDPEAQSLLIRFRGDFVAMLADAADGRLPDDPPAFDPRPAVTVVVAARGYPGAPQTGGAIGGLERMGAEADGPLVVHAGTTLSPDGRVIATGGRVLGISAVRDSAEAARHAVYDALKRLDYADGFWRRDIGEPDRFPVEGDMFHVKQTDKDRKHARILFVCLGNICRSPLAEGVFRRAAADVGLEVEIDSAATGDWQIGRSPDPRAQAIARANGIDISGRVARQVREQDFRRFTHIVAMDLQNLADLHAIRPPDATAALSAMMSHAPERGLTEVPDPYYGDEADFRRTWDLIDVAARGLVERLKA